MIPSFPKIKLGTIKWSQIPHINYSANNLESSSLFSSTIAFTKLLGILILTLLILIIWLNSLLRIYSISSSTTVIIDGNKGFGIWFYSTISESVESISNSSSNY